jgi:hypothetical protein
MGSNELELDRTDGFEARGRARLELGGIRYHPSLSLALVTQSGVVDSQFSE